ncbi:MAG: GTP cyclohydrolase [Omnitrophica bacterium GWA2_52_8]|nr:MAG: GTP cyclohydrolase [Omnitrophica bacterium GWA2_52_8]
MDPVPQEKILEVAHKDESGLIDYHRMEGSSVSAIDKVGINNFRLPMQFRYKDGTLRSHDVIASSYVHCPPGQGAISMSRFCEILTVEAAQGSVNAKMFRRVLGRLRRDLRERPTDHLFRFAFLKLKFKYALKQMSLKSPNWGWQYYDCELEGVEDKDSKIRMYLTVYYQYSSTCPCSLSMAKQYENAFAQGETAEGNGIANAHSQRSQAKCTVEYVPDSDFCVEDLVNLLRQAVPTETQSLVKRVDEQAFAILNGQHPVFVEHVVRRFRYALNQEPRVQDWTVAVEHWESLHSHNAVAVMRKGITGGLQ